MIPAKRIVAFKIGARARKLLEEDCPIEGYEMLATAIEECRRSNDLEMQGFLSAEMTKYEERMAAAI